MMFFAFNAQEVFQIAMEIEENGRAFYEKAQGRIDDEEVKAIFKDLAIQEVEHKKRFEELKAQLPSETASPTVQDPNQDLNQYLKMMADEHVFRTSENVDAQLETINSGEDALKLAIQFEKDSVIFFLSMQDATDEGKGRDYINLLVKEEQGHLRKLSLQLRKKKAH
jgi:rubrerythrin